MKRFFTFLLIGGAAFAAYTLGAKAGRGRYREIRAAANAVWNDPDVRKARLRATKNARKAATKASKNASKSLKRATR